MKKVYQKPWLYVETFELVEHIAGCGVFGYANHTGVATCGFNNGDPNGMIFLTSNPTKCDYDPYGGEIQTDEDVQALEMSCKYSTFADSYIMFSS